MAGNPVASERFPPPPVYYKSYGVGGKLHSLAVSLDPPVLPIKSFQCYGEEWDLEEREKTLAEEGREQLFEQENMDIAAEIRKLSALAVSRYKDILTAYNNMDLPIADMKEKVDEMENVYINLLYLVNQLRPGQGRHILISKMEQQIKKRLETTERLDKLVAEGEEGLKVMLDSFSQNTASPVIEPETVKTVDNINVFSIT